MDAAGVRDGVLPRTAFGGGVAPQVPQGGYPRSTLTPFLLSSLDLNDTKVHGPWIRALTLTPYQFMPFYRKLPYNCFTIISMVQLCGKFRCGEGMNWAEWCRMLSHIIYLLISLWESTPQQSRQFIVYYYWFKYWVDGFELGFNKNYNMFSLILLINIGPCGNFPLTKCTSRKCFDMKLTLGSLE